MKIRKIRQLIGMLERYPKSYNQGCWGHPIYRRDGLGREDAHCSAAACLAGYTVIMEGYQLLYQPGAQTSVHCRKGTETAVIFDLAQEILGLSTPNADTLFDSIASGWRHQREFLKARGREQKALVAIKELRDLIRLGVYNKRIKRKKPVAAALPPAVPEAPKPKVEFELPLYEPEPKPV